MPNAIDKLKDFWTDDEMNKNKAHNTFDSRRLTKNAYPNCAKEEYEMGTTGITG